MEHQLYVVQLYTSHIFNPASTDALFVRHTSPTDIKKSAITTVPVHDFQAASLENNLQTTVPRTVPVLAKPGE